MKLEEIISEQMKTAMKSGEKLRLETLRSLRAAILEFKTSGANREMTEEDDFKILNVAAKKRRDAIDMYDKAGRTDLLEKEQAELAVIQEFLPKQLTNEEIAVIVNNIVSETGAQGMKDMGKVMGTAMKAAAGKADGNAVQIIVKEILGKM